MSLSQLDCPIALPHAVSPHLQHRAFKIGPYITDWRQRLAFASVSEKELL